MIFVREVGGSMAPLWKNMIESGKTQIIYCVDASAPERVGQATINLIGKILDLELDWDNDEPRVTGTQRLR